MVSPACAPPTSALDPPNAGSSQASHMSKRGEITAAQANVPFERSRPSLSLTPARKLPVQNHPSLHVVHATSTRHQNLCPSDHGGLGSVLGSRRNAKRTVQPECHGPPERIVVQKLAES